MKSMTIKENLINHFYTYNNVIILRYTIQLKENNVDDTNMLGRMVMYLTTDDLKQQIDNYLLLSKERSVRWLKLTKQYSKNIIIMTIKAYNLKDQQPFTNYNRQRRSQLKELIPLIHVLCPNGLENISSCTIQERNQKRIRTIETNNEYCSRMGFEINSKVFYQPLNEYGVITKIAPNGIIEYDSVKTQMGASTWKSQVLQIPEPIWNEVLTRGITREAHVLTKI